MPGPARADTEHRLPAVTWIAAIAVAVVARTIALDRWPGINGDESWYGVNIQEFLNGGTPFWHTGIGNPLNPIHSGLLLPLHAVFQPSGTLLRLPEVILGVAAVAIAYRLLSRPLGHRAAVLVTLMLAISPTAVAYARFGWDPSGTPLLTLWAVGLALADRPFLSLIISALAFLVHPTNTFIVPVLAGAWAPHAIDRYNAASVKTRSRWKQLAVISAVAAIPLAAWMAVRIAANPNTTLPSISMVIDRLSSPSLWLERAWGFLDLLSGVSAVIHIAGPLDNEVALGVSGLILVLLLISLAAGWRVLGAHRHGRWLATGVAAAFAGFHIVAMDVALEPTFERYGLFMLVPMILLLAMSLDAMMQRYRLAGYAATAAMVAILSVLLVGGYFYPLAARGGDAMVSFRTGVKEPKLAAFEFIQSDSKSNSTRVMAESWWLYWTLRYFAGPDGPIRVEPTPDSSMPGGIRPEGTPAPTAVAAQRTYVVVFAGSRFPATIALSDPIFTAFDPIGRPVVQVFSPDSH
jgi:uncharacterized membrane protein